MPDPLAAESRLHPHRADGDVDHKPDGNLVDPAWRCFGGIRLRRPYCSAHLIHLNVVPPHGRTYGYRMSWPGRQVAKLSFRDVTDKEEQCVLRCRSRSRAAPIRRPCRIAGNLPRRLEPSDRRLLVASHASAARLHPRRTEGASVPGDFCDSVQVSPSNKRNEASHRVWRHVQWPVSRAGGATDRSM